MLHVWSEVVVAICKVNSSATGIMIGETTTVRLIENGSSTGIDVNLHMQKVCIVVGMA